MIQVVLMRAGAGAIRATWQMRAWGAGRAVAKPSTPERRSATDLSDADDAALVSAFQAGRREAFDVIVVRHRRSVYQLCYRFVSNHEDASDLAQDVFVRAFKGLQRFKGDAALATWLYRVAVNACLNRAAVKKPATTELDAAVHVDTRAANPLEDVLREERAAAVRDAIAKLPPKQRATLMLRIYQECSHEEIATALGSTVGAAKANFFHALGNLRRILDQS
jgi:RNA polymerase sigma-70 factor (ECF subfamily)